MEYQKGDKITVLSYFDIFEVIMVDEPYVYYKGKNSQGKVLRTRVTLIEWYSEFKVGDVVNSKHLKLVNGNPFSYKLLGKEKNRGTWRVKIVYPETGAETFESEKTFVKKPEISITRAECGVWKVRKDNNIVGNYQGLVISKDGKDVPRDCWPVGINEEMSPMEAITFLSTYNEPPPIKFVPIMLAVKDGEISSNKKFVTSSGVFAEDEQEVQKILYR